MRPQTVKLRSVAEINPRFKPGNLPSNTRVSFVPMASVSDVTHRLENEESRNLGDVAKGYTSFKRGDLLIAKITPCFENGKIAVADISESIGYGSTEFHVIRPRAGKLDPRYLFHFVLRDEFRVLGEHRMTGSAGQKRVPQQFLQTLEIPLPPLEEQRRIAAILDTADTLRTKRRQAIAKLDTLLQSTFLTMFGDLFDTDPAVSLSDLAELNPRKTELNASLERSARVTFVPMPAVSEQGDIDVSETRLLDDVWNGYTYFAEGDVLFAKITPCMENGKGAIARNLTNKVGFGSTEFHVLRPKEPINAEWLYTLLSLPSFRTVAESRMTGSAGQKRVPSRFFDKFRLGIPSKDSVERFAAFKQGIEQQKRYLSDESALLNNLFNSLQQRAFRGDL